MEINWQFIHVKKKCFCFITFLNMYLLFSLFSIHGERKKFFGNLFSYNYHVGFFRGTLLLHKNIACVKGITFRGLYCCCCHCLSKFYFAIKLNERISEKKNNCEMVSTVKLYMLELAPK